MWMPGLRDAASAFFHIVCCCWNRFVNIQVGLWRLILLSFTFVFLSAFLY